VVGSNPTRGSIYKENIVNEEQMRALSGKPTVYKAKHILVGTKGEAEELLEGLTVRNFGRIACDYSQCATGANYGIIEPFVAGSMWPQFMEALLAAPLNEIVGPFRDDAGWHLMIRTQ
jgi:parvulin-like peptidyl-prolyl isomerase